MTRLLFSFKSVLLSLFILCLIISNNSFAGSVAFNSFVSASGGASGVSTIARFKGLGFAANDAVYVRKAVQIGKSSVANILRRRAFSPWGAAAVVAITAAGYLIDQDSGTIKKNIAPQYLNGYWQHSGSKNTCCYTTADEALQSWWTEYQKQWGTQYCYHITGNYLKGVYFALGCGASGGGNVKFYENANYPEAQLNTGSSAVTDDELYDAVKSYSPGQWNDLFINPETGALEPEAKADLESTRQQLETDLNNQYDADPNNDPTVAPEEELDSQQDDNANNEPDDYEVQFDEPVTDDGLTTYDIPSLSVPSQGSYSCPANPSVTTSKGTFNLDIQPICTGLTDLRPVIIAVFFLIAAYIVVGVKRDG